MSNKQSLRILSAISLFVEDLAVSKAFYTSIFNADIVFEDEKSAALQFHNTIINLLVTSDAAELVKPRQVGMADAGKRFQMSVWVEDLEDAVEVLRKNSVELLSGPETKPWGMRTVTFEDPAGNNWEFAQRI